MQEQNSLHTEFQNSVFTIKMKKNPTLPKFIAPLKRSLLIYKTFELQRVRNSKK